MSLSCICIDDEPLSHEILENYIEKVPGLRLQASFYNAIDALAYLNQNSVDLIFLDINMPELTGIGLLKSLHNPPAVIFTSAYPEYAVDGFDLKIVDFLLKPFSFERFLKAVNKVFQSKNNISDPATGAFLVVKDGKKIYRIKHDEIRYFESAGDYVKVHTAQKVHVVNETLKHFEGSLPTLDFLRVHRSFIISIAKIDYLDGNQVYISKMPIPIGKSYKEALVERLQHGAGSGK